MKANFKISRTSEGVWGREVNPFQKRELEYYTGLFWFESDKGKAIEMYEDHLHSYELRESQLQEYPLTEESILREIATDRTIPYGAKYFTRREFYFGQLIQGEIVIEDGIKKIRLAYNN